jgi:hypothetical protein
VLLKASRAASRSLFNDLSNLVMLVGWEKHIVALAIGMLAAQADEGANGQTVFDRGRGQSNQYVEGWGQILDPKGDCKIAMSQGTLFITVPGTFHNLNPMPDWNNMDAPRVLQSVVGDFQVQVLASRFEVPAPNTGSNKKRPTSIVFSGVVVWQDAQNYVRFARSANGDNNLISVGMEYFSKGKKVSSYSVAQSDEDTVLFLSRTKDSIFMSHRGISEKSWPANGGIVVGDENATTLQKEVLVGVFVINSTNREITHKFSHFQLTRK